MTTLAKRNIGASLRYSFMETPLLELLWVLCFFVLAFQTFLRDIMPLFNYADEGVTLILFFLALIKASKKAGLLYPREKRAIVLIFLCFVVGVIGNITGGVAVSLSAIGIDMFTCAKFCVALLSGLVVFDGNSDSALRVIAAISRVLIVVLVICAVTNLFVDIGMSNSRSSTRWGLRAFSFIFYHPTVVNALCVGIVGILATDVQKNKSYILLALLVICLTLRAKGFAFAAASIMLLLMMNTKTHLSPSIVFLGVTAAIFIGYDQFLYYYADSNQARSALMTASLQIANDYFPTGAGFATFASSVTTDSGNYSPLYYEYGLSTISGLSPSDSRYISDTFFPILLGQFGWCGCIFYLLFLYEVFMSLYRRVQKSYSNTISVVLVIAYLIISSTSESAFFSNTSVYFAICMAMSCCSKQKEAPAVKPDLSNSVSSARLSLKQENRKSGNYPYS